MKRILVTGASGYLGSQFIELYKEKYSFQKFSLLKSSIIDLDIKDVDYILHCAALVHQSKELSYQEYYKVNVEYPLKLAEKAKSKGVRQFVFISTIAVYDNSLKYVDENSKTNPSTPYGKTKLEAEKLLQKLNGVSFKVSIIRLPMIYGKDAPGNISKLQNLVKKFSIIPFGGIENKRTFTYIKNLCFGINEIINKELKGTFLISDDDAISTSDLIKLIAKNKKSRTYFIRPPLLKFILKISKPNIYTKLYGDLVVNNLASKQKINYITPYKIEEAFNEM